jgi:cellulose synthase/poly-beta-1,6-N-acetylglucosamine synthase-like glycosyltransferase
LIFLLVFAGTFTFGYIALLIYYLHYFKTTVERTPPPLAPPLPFCSVIIAARNEEQHIRTCLGSVTNQTYPVDRYEVLVVNDGSNDGTVTEVQKYTTVRLLHTTVTNAGKKNAIALGIVASKGEIIVTTDGDCEVRPEWLQSLVENFVDAVQMVTGPVMLSLPRNAFERFQALDVAGLAIVTGAGIESGLHHLANGANMAFKRETFDAVCGFSGNINYASGDDVFLIQAIARTFPGSVRYVSSPEALVLTKPCISMQEFVQQRLRWATKNSVLRERSIYWIWVCIWLTYVMNSIAFGTAVVAYSLPVFLISSSLLCLIAIMEQIFLKRILSKYGRLDLLRGYPMSFILHYGYVLLIGLAVLVRRRYKWKGRELR